MSCSARQALILVLAYTTLAVAWGWRLHAGDRALPAAADATLDRTRGEVAARLVRAPAPLQRPALFQLAMLPDADVRALREWARSSSEQRLRQLTVQTGPVAAPSALNTALLFAELAQPDVLQPDDMRLLVSAAGSRLEEPHRVAALELLAAQAAAACDFDVALQIHLRIVESPAVAWRHVLALTDAARLARRPAAALRVVGVWLDAASKRLDAAQREDALDLQTDLLLEGGRHAEASRLALDALRALPADAAIPPRLLERALLAARAADESIELLPWLERHLRTFPEQHLSFEDLAAGRPASAAFLHWLREATLIADAKGQASIACEGCFRLAAAGDLRMLARLHELAAQTQRGPELGKLMMTLQRRLGPTAVAQALAAGGAPQAARDFLAAALAAQPQQRAGWQLLTQMDAALQPPGAAASLWQGLVKRFPGDAFALRQLASSQRQAGQLSQALRTLQQIPEGKLDAAALREIASLAIQLDDLPAARHAQELLVHDMTAPAIPDVLLLADLTRQHADAESQAALASAIAKLPARSAFQQSLRLPATTGEATHFNTAAQPR